MFNKQGRMVSERMQIEAYKRYIAANKPKPLHAEDYRGFRIEQNGGSGRGKGWTITTDIGTIWPCNFSSLAKARAQVDACLSLRAEMAKP
jgi:hypothetical protein